MSNAFEDFINSDEFQGVTRTDGRNVERGDRDDEPKVKRQVIPYEFDEQESKAKLRARLSDMDAKHKRALIESGYGQVPEGQKSGYREAHEASAKRRLADAIAEGQAITSQSAELIDGHSTPHEKYKDNTGFLIAVVIACAAFITLIGG